MSGTDKFTSVLKQMRVKLEGNPVEGTLHSTIPQQGMGMNACSTRLAVQRPVLGAKWH